MNEPMSDDQFTSVVAALVRQAEHYRNARAEDRVVAVEYYHGVMRDVPSDENRSQVVSSVLREHMKKVKPSLIRTFFGGANLVEYIPVGRDDEQAANQATDYVNAVIVPECDARKAIEDAIDDALLQRNGILHWWCEQRGEVKVSYHDGLDEMAMASLANDPNVTIMEMSERPGDFGTIYSARVRRVQLRKRICLGAVPPEEFLIDPDAISADDATLVGRVRRYRRQDLVAMGYDPEAVAALSVSSTAEATRDYEWRARRPETPMEGEIDPNLQEVDFYELFVRLDADGDGIPELRRVVMAGSVGVETVLENEEWDDVPFADVKGENRPHMWEGWSLADDLMHLQRVKTVLLRQAIDNMYWANMPQPIVDVGALDDPDDVLNPAFGKPIRVKNGRNVNEAVKMHAAPFIANHVYDMLAYIDGEAQNRTGINDASGGMAPDALQNTTAKAAAMLESSGIAAAEAMTRTMAEGIRRAFKGLLKLVIQHQDKARIVRLRGEWVEFDPRQWNSEMDVSVNVGLGAGTRERDLLMIGAVAQAQEKLAAMLGPGNPIITPEEGYNTAVKLVEAAGLKNADPFFRRPKPGELDAWVKSKLSQPSPEQQKLEAELTLERERMAAARDKESAQAEADILVKQAEQQKDAAKADAEMALELERIRSEREIEAMRMAHDAEQKRLERETTLAIEAMKIKAQMQSAMVSRPDAVNVGDDDEPVMKPAASIVTDAMAQLANAVTTFSQALERSNGPKRVIRDPATGDVIGVEPMGMN